ncbi:MAG: hypothetical protein ABIJ56_03315 [Pseudomonadota bacterium]
MKSARLYRAALPCAAASALVCLVQAGCGSAGGKGPAHAGADLYSAEEKFEAVNAAIDKFGAIFDKKEGESKESDDSFESTRKEMADAGLLCAELLGINSQALDMLDRPGPLNVKMREHLKEYHILVSDFGVSFSAFTEIMANVFKMVIDMVAVSAEIDQIKVDSIEDISAAADEFRARAAGFDNTAADFDALDAGADTKALLQSAVKIPEGLSDYLGEMARAMDSIKQFGLTADQAHMDKADESKRSAEKKLQAVLDIFEQDIGKHSQQLGALYSRKLATIAGKKMIVEELFRKEK